MNEWTASKGFFFAKPTASEGFLQNQLRLKDFFAKPTASKGFFLQNQLRLKAGT